MDFVFNKIKSDMFKGLLVFHQIDSEHLAHEKEKRLIK